jgi:hypothetical protein
MKTLMLFGAGMAALALAGCNRDAPANAAANQPAAANAAAPVNMAANAPGEMRQMAIDEERLVETCVPAADRERSIDTFSADERTRLITCINAETARQAIAQLPVRIDSRTLMERMTAEGPVLTYHYRVTVPLAEFTPGAADRIDAFTRSNACAGGRLDQTFAMGGVHIYRWTDRDGALIREVRIDRC